MDRHQRDELDRHITGNYGEDSVERDSPWGSYKGRKRNPCPEKPELLLGKPIGQYHCPGCGEMQLAGLPHMAVDDEWEDMTGEEWPFGYDGKDLF